MAFDYSFDLDFPTIALDSYNSVLAILISFFKLTVISPKGNYRVTLRFYMIFIDYQGCDVQELSICEDFSLIRKW